MTTTDVMRKYIEQTRELDAERSALMTEISHIFDDLPKNTDLDFPDRFYEIDKRLTSIYHAQTSNAIILADMLESVLNESKAS